MANPVWKEARRRARAETLDLIRLNEPFRALLTIGVPLVVMAASWEVIGQFAHATLAGLSAIIGFGLLIYCVKLLLAPAKIAQEKQAEMEALIAGRDIAECERRRNVMGGIIRLYALSHDGITPQLLAGLELPPMDWLNEQLSGVGEPWQIVSIKGTAYQTIQIIDQSGKA